MRIIKEDEGIQLLVDQEGGYFLQYDVGAHMVKEKRIEITADEVVVCQHHGSLMYNTILQYQNAGIYGEDV